MTGKRSECSNCGSVFNANERNYLYCSSSCEREHDLFKSDTEQLNWQRKIIREEYVEA